MVQARRQVAYGLSQALIPENPASVIAKRAPTTGDFGYLLSTIWIDTVGQAAYILTSISSNIALWQLVAPAGGGSFTTLTSTGQFNLDTTAAAANTLGNTTGATSVAISVGTGGFSVDGVTNSTYTIGASTTTGTITIGGTAQTGTITLGSSSGTNILALGTGAGATTVNIATGVTNAKTVNIGTGAAMANTLSIGGTGANVIAIGNTQTAGSISIGAAMTSGTLNLGSTAAGVGIITIGGGTGAQTLNIAAAGTGTKTINIGATGSANVISIGSTTAASTLALKTPTGTAVTAANGLTATVGDITASNGNVVLSTAASFVQLPGPVNISSGAGAPANGLALHIGDMYIRTDAGGATERIYVATGVGAWTNVTCAA